MRMPYFDRRDDVDGPIVQMRTPFRSRTSQHDNRHRMK